jgi:hypothetical protein
MKDVQAFSPQKRTCSTSKDEIYLLFSTLFVGHFLPSWIRIRIANLDPDTNSWSPLNPDPIQYGTYFFLIGKILCCECGTPIDPNPANLCVACLRTQVDITEGIPKQVKTKNKP